MVLNPIFLRPPKSDENVALAEDIDQRNAQNQFESLALRFIPQGPDRANEVNRRSTAPPTLDPRPKRRLDRGMRRLLMLREGKNDEMQRYLNGGWKVVSVTEGKCFDWVVIKKKPALPPIPEL